MKRYRLLKDFPEYKAGEIIETDLYGNIFGWKAIDFPDFFEEVKEKDSLEEKFVKNNSHEASRFADLAKSHYLSIFDEARKEAFNVAFTETNRLNLIRKRLEEG